MAIMLAALDMSDYVVIAVIVSLFTSGSTYALLAGSERTRLARLEQKLNLILQHLGISYTELAGGAALSAEVQQLAGDPARKIEAIKLHREQTGASLREAKDAVEAFINGPRPAPR
jgi:hypothetical protein